jgi:hypothetical protein
MPDHRERAQRIEFADRRGGFEDLRGMHSKVAQQPDKELQLEFLEARLRAQNLALEFLERGCGEAFRADQRLLALVVSGRALGVGFGDFDVVAEDLVVADLERGDAGALALRGFQTRDDAARVEGQRAHLVDLQVEAGADGVAVARIDRRLIADGGVDLRRQVG